MRHITDGVTTIDFPTGTLWADEFWTPVVQAGERSIDGALILDIQTRTGGQPLTFQSSSDDSGWLRKADIDALTVWSRDPTKVLTVVWDSFTWTTMFRHYDAPAFEPRPVTDYDDPASDDPYTFSLRLVEVTP